MIITFGHVKGGTGKSTLTVNVGAELQRRGHDIVIIDADPSLETTSRWGSDREEAGLPAIPILRKTGNLRPTLIELAEKYDDVLVDAAGKDSRELRTAATASDVFVAPTQPSQADLDSLSAFTPLITQARDFNPELRVLAVLNRASTHVWADDVADATKYLDDYPELDSAETVIYERKAYKNCLTDGRGVVEMTDTKAKAEIQLLTIDITREDQ